MDAHEAISADPQSGSSLAKRFTIDEANRAIPLIRRITEDVVACYRRFQEVDSRHRELTDRGELNDRIVPLEDVEKIGDERDRIRDRLLELRDELSEIGVELKDWEMGLIDFPGMRGERDVCLCWKLGEKSVAYWHEIRAGYGGRKAIDEEFEEACER